MKRVEVLWTGGFDSTFRISQLSRCDVEIQPIYVCNPKRESRFMELRAIDEMTEMFKDLDQTKAKFLPLEIIMREDCGENEILSQARRNISKTVLIGYQYDYLAGFSRQRPGIELSVHDNVIDLLKDHGELKKIHNDAIGDYYVVDQTKTPEDLVTLFKDFHFPLVNYTKKLMREEYKSNGLSDIMNKTWFCHAPINDKPCGECNPCKYTIEEGLYGRFDARALFRYVLRKLRIKLMIKYSKMFLKVTKREMKRYRKYLKKTRKVYANLFKKFRKEWKK